MLLSLRRNGLTSLFKEVRVFKVSALVALYKNPRQSRPEALLEGSENFRESVFSGTFSSPHTFAPPISQPNLIFAPLLREEGGGGSEGRGNFSKIRGKRGKKRGGGRGRCRKRVGGIFWGEGSLIFILRVEEPP